MRLRDLLKYETIVNQCHDNPDADAIASGFGLYTYFKEKGKTVSLIPYAKICIAKGGIEIYIKPLNHRVKIFTEWDDENYMLGRAGDYLAVRKDDLRDVYVIAGDMFEQMYEVV